MKSVAIRRRITLTKDHMALIADYKPFNRTFNSKFATGGFDPVSREFTPFETVSSKNIEGILDAFAIALESGYLDSEKWVSQVFASKVIFEQFLVEFVKEYETWRIHDRWYWALVEVANAGDPAECARAEDIAYQLAEAAKNSGQI